MLHVCAPGRTSIVRPGIFDSRIVGLFSMIVGLFYLVLVFPRAQISNICSNSLPQRHTQTETHTPWTHTHTHTHTHTQTHTHHGRVMVECGQDHLSAENKILQSQCPSIFTTYKSLNEYF
jgi:ABC-type nickel/cobalt efflux system permease component RcnA